LYAVGRELLAAILVKFVQVGIRWEGNVDFSVDVSGVEGVPACFSVVGWGWEFPPRSGKFPGWLLVIGGNGLLTRSTFSIVMDCECVERLDGLDRIGGLVRIPDTMFHHVWRIAVVAGWLFLGCGVEAKTVHVSPTGREDAEGTEENPLLSLQKAADRARAGDTILLHGGVYTQTVIMRFSGEAGKPITLTSRKGEEAVIKPVEKGQRPAAQGILLQAEAGYQHAIGWIVIDGVEIRNAYDGVKIYNAHDVVIRNCRIHDSWNQGILGSGNRVLIERNVIAGNGIDPKGDASLKHGIYAMGTDFRIINNLIVGNSAYGIQVAAYDYKPKENPGPEFAEAKNWLIANNTLAFNKVSSGIVLWQDGVENCVIRNNIFFKNGGCNGITFYTQKGRRHVVKNNIFFPAGENLAATEPDAYDASDNLQVDPLFENPESFNFRLKAGSPAIDKGADLTERGVKVDLDGGPRPQGKAFDIGAHEFKEGGASSRRAATGPLRVHPQNPRYFTDGTKYAGRDLPRAVYLTGSHTWNVLQDSPGADPFDYDGFLDFLAKYNHNFFRLWTRMGTGGGPPTPVPTIYERTGPGKGNDGELKYDLRRFNAHFFERLRARVKAAGDRGIYVAVMFFAGDNVENTGGNPNWPLHPYHKENNINGVNGDRNGDDSGFECYRLEVEPVTKLQEGFVRKVVETVGGLDNVLWEVGNELRGTLEFQEHFVQFVKQLESSRTKQHPVGISTFGDAKPSMSEFVSGRADWITSDNGGGDYMGDPPANEGKKIIISDTDHLWGVGGDADWVWKTFTRGLHPIYMDPLPSAEERKDEGKAQERESARLAMGHTLKRATAMNLASMAPRNELASTKYCLANPGVEYLIYQPHGGKVFSVELKAGVYRYEWFEVTKAEAVKTGLTHASAGRQNFTPPFDRRAVLYLKQEER
jgi:hypothetical protein